MTPAPKRRWLRFSLRTLFVVVTVFGLLAGWIGYQLNWIRQRRAFISEQREQFRDIGFDADVYASNNYILAPHGAWLVGESGVAKMFVLHEKGQRERAIQRAQRLFPEAKITVTFERPDKIDENRETLSPPSAPR